LAFFDRLVLGSGDFFWLIAALGITPTWFSAKQSRRRYAYLQGSSYPAWAARAHERIGGRIGCLEGSLLHLYHGEISDRRYFDRHAIFDREGLDIERDLAPSPDGPWQFASPRPTWEAALRRYFLERREDGS
jgi:hypothetical protein